MAKPNNENQNKPQASNTLISVSLPDKPELKLVQANELKHYELFQWLVAVLLPIAVGFWTAYASASDGKNILFFSSIVFSAVSILFPVLSFYYRSRVFRESLHLTRTRWWYMSKI